MLSFFPRDVLDEIWDLIESVSEGFPSFSNTGHLHKRVKYTKEKVLGLRPFQEYSLLSLSRYLHFGYLEEKI